MSKVNKFTSDFAHEKILELADNSFSIAAKKQNQVFAYKY